MASACIASCVNDARIPVRATYVNLYKWPESDAEFVRSVTSSNSSRKDGHHHHHKNVMYGHPRVVDSFSCRQMYLRSYTFSREEDHAEEKTFKCLGCATKEKHSSGSRKKKCAGVRKATCSALETVFRRLLSCTTKIDVVT